VSKIEGGLQELEETAYWLELLAESGIVAELQLADTRREADELTAILVSCAKAAKSHK
jgi:four helix bundle protein